MWWCEKFGVGLRPAACACARGHRVAFVGVAHGDVVGGGVVACVVVGWRPAAIGGARGQMVVVNVGVAGAPIVVTNTF
jgi:hypothetical protein